MLIAYQRTEGRKSNSRRRFLTISALIRLLCVSGVTGAVSTAVRNRLRRWDRHMYRSCRRVVTRGRPLLDLSFVVPVCRRRWYKRIIVDLLTWKFLAVTAWDVARSSIWTAALRWSCVKRKILPDFWNPNSRQHNMSIWRSYCIHLMYCTGKYWKQRIANWSD